MSKTTRIVLIVCATVIVVALIAGAVLTEQAIDLEKIIAAIGGFVSGGLTAWAAKK